MVSNNVRQDSISTVPVDSICVYCCKPREASAEEAPEARKASFRAIDKSAAFPRSPVSKAKLCVLAVISDKDVGRPWIPSVSFSVAALASSASKPICCMTFGNCLRVSNRSTALLTELRIADKADSTTFDAAPKAVPILITDSEDRSAD